MVGKIFITRSGYDPQLGKHVKDPYLGRNPTLGACRPDVRKQLTKGDHIFVISGRVPVAPQYVMAGFEIAAKIDGLTAYQQLPEHRLQLRDDGQLTGNIICGPDGRQHELDNHNSFEKRMQNYVIGTNLVTLTTDEEIERAKHLPPQTTRARLRGEFIRQANLKGKDYRVDWVYLKLNDPERETILCKDPFQSHDERVERLIRSF